MELTPQLFRDVEFTERRGAYDKDEVNAFLARVGTAVGQLQERVREAQRRVEAAESQLVDAQSSSNEHDDATETIQRMIENATRFSDEAMKEARESADQIVAQARKKADDMIVQAEEAVRRDVGATRDRLQAEIRDLEGHRDDLRSRIDTLGEHLGHERGRMRDELARLIALLEDPDTLAVAEPPGTEPEPVIVLSETPVGGSAEDSAAESPASVDADVDQDEELAHLPPPPEDWEPPAELRDPDPHDGGPPTEPHPVVGPGSAFGGSHLDELRRAVSEDAPDPESDAAMAAFFDQDEDERARRFGRRR